MSKPQCNHHFLFEAPRMDFICLCMVISVETVHKPWSGLKPFWFHHAKVETWTWNVLLLLFPGVSLRWNLSQGFSVANVLFLNNNATFQLKTKEAASSLDKLCKCSWSISLCSALVELLSFWVHVINLVVLWRREPGQAEHSPDDNLHPNRQDTSIIRKLQDPNVQKQTLENILQTRSCNGLKHW